MEQIPLVKTQNLGIIPASILECWQFGTEQHVSSFDFRIAEYNRQSMTQKYQDFAFWPKESVPGRVLYSASENKKLEIQLFMMDSNV